MGCTASAPKAPTKVPTKAPATAATAAAAPAKVLDTPAAAAAATTIPADPAVVVAVEEEAEPSTDIDQVQPVLVQDLVENFVEGVTHGVASAVEQVKELLHPVTVAEATEFAAEQAAATSPAAVVPDHAAAAVVVPANAAEPVHQVVHPKYGGTLNLGEDFPDISAPSTLGKIRLYTYFANGWGILFSHPADFTPVCTTELNIAATYADEFAKRNCRMLALSCDSVDSHDAWTKDVCFYDGSKFADLPFPILADESREIATKLGMLDPVAKDAAGLPLTCRAVFIVGPDFKLKLSVLYPATTGRNFDELLRVLDSLQLTAQRKLATPADWKHGDECIVVPSVSTEDAQKLFPQGLRIVDLPSSKQTGLNLGDEFPNFALQTTAGEFKLHDYLGESSWGVVFSHPADFTPVCTTELSAASKRNADFAKRNVKLLAVSCDSVESHHAWITDVTAYGRTEEAFAFPIIADPNREIATQLGMLDAVAKDAAGMPLTARAVFIISPDKKLKLSLLYPATTGRNFDEILRCVDSLQLTAQRKLATPGNWKYGDECIVSTSVSTEDAHTLFPKGLRIVDLPSSKQYLRFTPM
ncbi:hypothetical protein BASA81_001920 [Batrachochytrium salamandrivorans]|nr:hypothetical protein BASA81_001920 [Batrachochytrium salamandrivorans]